MNILAHYILSQRDEEVVVGNIIADFIKGYDITIFPEGIRKGIQLHKKIDIYSDNHPVVRESWSILQKDFGHYGRVITDIYYDHFLISHWGEYSEYSFPDDLSYLYQCLNHHAASFPPKIRRLTSRIVAMQWPLKYSDMTGLYHVFRSMSKRVAFENKFELAVEVLQKEYNALDSHFCRFFPDLKVYANQQLEILSSNQ